MSDTSRFLSRSDLRQKTVDLVWRVRDSGDPARHLDVIKSLSIGADPWGRSEAQEFLLAIPGNEALALLVGALNDCNPAIARHAAMTLARRGDAASFAALADAFAFEQSDDLDHLAMAMAQFGTRGMNWLVAATRHGTPPQRFAAVNHLVPFRSSREAMVAVRDLLDDADQVSGGTPVSSAARRALGLMTEGDHPSI